MKDILTCGVILVAVLLAGGLTCAMAWTVGLNTFVQERYVPGEDITIYALLIGVVVGVVVGAILLAGPGRRLATWLMGARQ